MKKILVATDGSDNSEKALIEARKYAECSSGEITILTIVESLVMKVCISLEDDAMLDNEKSKNAGETILKNSLNLLDDFKGEVNTKLRRGNPADEIIREAESGDYDIIVMGSKGLGAFSRTLLGSVSNKVLNHSNKSVFIIK